MVSADNMDDRIVGRSWMPRGTNQPLQYVWAPSDSNDCGIIPKQTLGAFALCHGGSFNNSVEWDDQSHPEWL